MYRKISPFTRATIIRKAIELCKKRAYSSCEVCLETASEDVSIELGLVAYYSYRVWFPEFKDPEYYAVMERNGYKLAREPEYYVDKGFDDEHTKRHLLFLEWLLEQVLNGQEIELRVD